MAFDRLLLKGLLTYLMGTGNYSAISNNMKLVYTLAVDGWAAYARHRPTHQRPMNVPITVLLCNRPLLCGSNVPVEGLTFACFRLLTTDHASCVCMVQNFAAAARSRM